MSKILFNSLINENISKMLYQFKEHLKNQVYAT